MTACVTKIASRHLVSVSRKLCTCLYVCPTERCSLGQWVLSMGCVEGSQSRDVSENSHSIFRFSQFRTNPFILLAMLLTRLFSEVLTANTNRLGTAYRYDRLVWEQLHLYRIHCRIRQYPNQYPRHLLRAIRSIRLPHQWRQPKICIMLSRFELDRIREYGFPCQSEVGMAIIGWITYGMCNSPSAGFSLITIRIIDLSSFVLDLSEFWYVTFLWTSFWCFRSLRLAFLVYLCNPILVSQRGWHHFFHHAATLPWK